MSAPPSALVNSAMMSYDEYTDEYIVNGKVTERPGYRTSCTEAKKMKSLTLHTH